MRLRRSIGNEALGVLDFVTMWIAEVNNLSCSIVVVEMNAMQIMHLPGQIHFTFSLFQIKMSVNDIIRYYFGLFQALELNVYLWLASIISNFFLSLSYWTSLHLLFCFLLFVSLAVVAMILKIDAQSFIFITAFMHRTQTACWWHKL